MKFKLLTIAIATIFILMGCQGTNEEGINDRGNRDNNIEQTRYNNDNTRNNRMNETNQDNRNDNRDHVRNRRDNVGNDRNNNNNEYNVSDEAADRITDEIEEIDSAYVLTTDNNAYVAAVLDNDNDDNNNNVGTNDDNDNRNNNNRDGANARNISNEGDTGSEVTDEVKEKISDIVQSVDKDIDNVYVTTNPDFADLTNDYVNDVNDGKPVRGFFDQIGNMVERVFPQDKR